MADTFSAESRLIHAGTERVSGRPATPPLAPASIYVSQGTPHPGRGYGRDGNPGWEALEHALGGQLADRGQLVPGSELPAAHARLDAG